MRALLALLLLSGVCAAAPPAVTVTPQSPAPGQLVTLSTASPVTWDIRGASHLPSPDGKSVALYLPASPVVVLAAGASPSPLAEVAVISLGQGGPIPPGPTPPPEPPKPPAPPDDPLARKLRSLYAEDPQQLDMKRDAAKNLAAMYRQCIAILNDFPTETNTSLLQRMQTASRVLVGDSLMGVRKEVAAELGKVLPTEVDTVLTDKHRQEAAVLFSRLAQIMDSME